MNRQIQKKLLKAGYKFVEPETEITSGSEPRPLRRSSSKSSKRSPSTDSDRVSAGGSTAEQKPVEKPFFKWFWENVLGYSTKEYRREYWKAQKIGHTIGPKPKVFHLPGPVTMRNYYEGFDDTWIGIILLFAPSLLFYVIRRILRRYIQRLQRPTYYERERERRIMLGHQRRTITRRTTYSAQPTFEAIRAAWNGARHSPEGALRLGGMLEDLECYVNNLTIGNEVEGYRGRRGGIKRLLQDKAPDLFEHYAAIMRYKSIARRFRQACGLDDPYPAEAVLPLSSPPRTPRTPPSALPSAFTTSPSALPSASTTSPSALPSTSKASHSRATCTTEALVAQQEEAPPRMPTPETICSEQIKRSNFVAQAGQTMQTTQETICSEQIKRANLIAQTEQAIQTTRMTEEAQTTQAMPTAGETQAKKCSPMVVQHGVKSWVLEGFVFARYPHWVVREAYDTCVRVLRRCENSVISLEASLALEIDPSCVTEEVAKSTGKSPAVLARNGANDLNAKSAGRKPHPSPFAGRGPADPLATNPVPNKSSENGAVRASPSMGDRLGHVSRRVTAWLRRRVPMTSCS